MNKFWLVAMLALVLLVVGCALPTVDLGQTPTPRPPRATFTPSARAVTIPSSVPFRFPQADPGKKYSSLIPGSVEILMPGEFLWILPSEKALDARTYALVKYEGEWVLGVESSGGLIQRVEKWPGEFEGFPKEIKGSGDKTTFRAGPLTYFANGGPVLGIYTQPGVRTLVQRPVVEGLRDCALDLESVWTPHQPGLFPLHDKIIERDRVEQFDSALILDINPAPVVLSYDEATDTFSARWLGGYPGVGVGIGHEGQYIRLSMTCGTLTIYNEYLWAGAPDVRKWFKVVPSP